MNKKIKTEIAVVVIIIIAFIAGGLICIKGRYFGDVVQTQSARLNPVNRLPAIQAQQSAQQADPTSQSVEDIASWQTYTSTKYGYIIKYPKGWFSYTDNVNDVFFQPIKEIPGSMPGPHASAFEIKITKTNERAESVIGALEKQAGIKYDKTNLKIGGEDSVKIISSCEGLGCGAPEWILIKNGNLYHFLSNLGYSSEFDKILSTFAFTN